LDKPRLEGNGGRGGNEDKDEDVEGAKQRGGGEREIERKMPELGTSD